MEYLKVEFKGRTEGEIDRGVLIDDQLSGRTFQSLMIGRGHHVISLEPSPENGNDFAPQEREINAKNTSSSDPMIVSFSQTSD